MVTAFGGLATAVAAAVLVQGYLLFDCSDGELARWSGRTSATGVFLDLTGHYLGEAALLIGLGVRAQGHLTDSGPYVSAGLAAAVFAMIVKAETHNVIGARAKAGLPTAHGDEALQPTGSGLALARRRSGRVHRITNAVELSMLILVAAVADEIRGGLLATRVLVVACAAVSADGRRAPGGDRRFPAAQVMPGAACRAAAGTRGCPDGRSVIYVMVRAARR